MKFQKKFCMVGRVTNYDKLILEIETDGSVEIHDALSYAVELLLTHVKPFTNIGNSMSKYRGDVEEEQEVEVAEPNTYGDMKIEELQLSVRATNGLMRAKINTLGDLA